MKSAYPNTGTGAKWLFSKYFMDALR